MVTVIWHDSVRVRGTVRTTGITTSGIGRDGCNKNLVNRGEKGIAVTIADRRRRWLQGSGNTVLVHTASLSSRDSSCVPHSFSRVEDRFSSKVSEPCSRFVASALGGGGGVPRGRGGADPSPGMAGEEYDWVFPPLRTVRQSWMRTLSTNPEGDKGAAGIPYWNRVPTRYQRSYVSCGGGQSDRIASRGCECLASFRRWNHRPRGG